MDALTRRTATADEAVVRKLDRTAYRLGRVLGRFELRLRGLPQPRPWMVLGPLALANGLVIADAARLAAHRGWLFSGGGDGTWTYTSAWVLGHGHIPQSSIGYGFSLLVAPLTWIAGSNLLTALPLIVLLNAVVLAPLALVCVYALSRLIGGLWFAYAAAIAWVVFPLVAMHYFYPDYHVQYVDVTLPAAVGLTALGDYPAMVCGLLAATFVYRALSSSSLSDGLTAGLVAGIMIGVKPADAVFLFAAFVALAVAGRPRQLACFAAGLAPSLAALALWKDRGLGHPAVFTVHLGRYIHLNWAHFLSNIDGFREYGWSQRLLMWLALAGFLGLARRSIPGAALVGGWLASYLFLRGGDPQISVLGGNFFIELLPALPAVFLLGVSVIFLVPVYGRRGLLPGRDLGWPRTTRSKRRLASAAAVLAVLPIAIFAFLPTLTRPAAAEVAQYDAYIPVGRFTLTARAAAGEVLLDWQLQNSDGGRASFIVFRSRSDGLSCRAIADASSRCAFSGPAVGFVAPGGSSFRDRPPAGAWSYRVALADSAFGPISGAEPLVLSTAASVEVNR